MPFCPNCGQSVEGRFCAACGATLGGASPGAPPPPPPSYQGAPQSNAQAGLPENAASALCYVLGLVTGILFLAISPYNQNPRIKFHAYQAIFFHLATIVFWVGSIFLLYLLPGPLAFLYGLLQLVIGLGAFLLWLFLMWKAYNNERMELPIVGPMAAAQAGR